MDDGSQQVLSDLLLGLHRMQEDPTGTANALERQTYALADEQVAEALRDVTVGVRVRRALLAATPS